MDDRTISATATDVQVRGPALSRHPVPAALEARPGQNRAAVKAESRPRMRAREMTMTSQFAMPDASYAKRSFWTNSACAVYLPRIDEAGNTL